MSAGLSAEDARRLTDVLTVVGWAFVVTLWQTTVTAGLVWVLDRLDRRSTPLRRYRLAGAGLVASVVLAAVTVWLLLDPPRRPAGGGVRSLHAAPAATPAPPPSSGASIESTATAAVRWVPGVAPIAGAAWLAIAGVMLLRLAGGLLTISRARRAAAPLASDALSSSLTRVALAVALPHPVALLRTDAVNAPAIHGHWRPAVLMPAWLADAPANVLEPLLAHELSHVRRRDYAANLMQRLAEALLAPFPGALWLGARIRHAREQRCDDDAARTCGDVQRYVEALATLASRVASTPAALPAAGTPRLIDRIHRLLKGDAMPRLTPVQGLLTFTAAAVLVSSGALVAATALEGARASRSAPAAQRQTAPPLMPYGYLTAQDGAPLQISGVESTDSHVIARVSVRNVSGRAVTDVIFLLVMERPGGLRPPGAPPDGPGRIAKFYPRAITLAPGETVDFEAGFVDAAEAAAVRDELGDRPQAMLGLQKVTFADGRIWEMTPLQTAQTADEYFHTPPAWVSRGLVAVAVPNGAAAVLCRDDRGLEYSPGAIVPVRGEPGAFARCRNGGWAAVAAPATAPR